MLSRILRAPFVLAVIATALMHADVANAEIVIKKGLVSYWTFDSVSIAGKTVKDIWPLIWKYDGELRGDPQIVPGIIGDALELDGDGDYMQVESKINALLRLGFTLEGWFNFTKTDKVHILLSSRQGPWLAAGGTELVYVNNFHREGFYLGARVFYDDGPCEVQHIPFRIDKAQLGQWFHFAVTYKGAAPKLTRIFVNGEQKAEVACKKAPKKSNAAFKIGWSHVEDRWFFIGLVDDVRVYNRPLEPAEVKNNFSAKKGFAVDPAEKLAVTWGELKVSR